MPLFGLTAKPALRGARQVRIMLLVAASAAAAAIGCGEARTIPPQVATQQTEDSPKAKLQRVMTRLRSALVDAQAAEGVGVESQRKSSYRLIPPTDDEPNYTAEVTIVTQARLADAGAAAAAGDAESTGANHLAPEDTKPQQKRETFTLVYKGDRWKLRKQPKGETEKILFEYALDL